MFNFVGNTAVGAYGNPPTFGNFGGNAPIGDFPKVVVFGKRVHEFRIDVPSAAVPHELHTLYQGCFNVYLPCPLLSIIFMLQTCVEGCLAIKHLVEDDTDRPPVALSPILALAALRPQHLGADVICSWIVGNQSTNQ